MNTKIVVGVTIIILVFAKIISYAQTSNEDIQNFVRDYLNRNSQNSVDYILKIYADQVDFYNEGLKGKDFIIRDKTNYFKKWTYRKYQLTSDIKISKSNSPREWLAEFNYQYNVSNDSKSLIGEAWCKLTIIENNGLKIAGEKGGLVKKTDTKDSELKIVQESNGIKLVVQNIEDPTEASVFYQPNYYYRLVGIEVTLQNNSNKSIELNVSNFSLEDTFGRIFEPALGSASRQIKIGEIKPKQKISGLVPFKIRADSELKFIVYDFKNSVRSLKLELK